MTYQSRAAQGRRGASFSGRKRALDMCVAGAGLIVLAPVFAAVAAAIRLEDGGPAIFLQVRVGLRGIPFRIAKFRSMTVVQDGRRSEITVAGDPRITRVGRFIRRFKIDELPQLWNVLIGEMSLVGPRPETPALLQQYSPAQRSAITSLRPGVTDWASLLLRDESELLAASPDPAAFYRDELTPLKCEMWECYRKEAGVVTDLRILAATLWAVAAPGAENPWLSPSARRCAEAASSLSRRQRGQATA
jgi:lipopolysaccharide/colanic/teichoic acid biosynthesis glycosyltransferase